MGIIWRYYHSRTSVVRYDERKRLWEKRKTFEPKIGKVGKTFEIRRQFFQEPGKNCCRCRRRPTLSLLELPKSSEPWDTSIETYEQTFRTDNAGRYATWNASAVLKFSPVMADARRSTSAITLWSSPLSQQLRKQRPSWRCRSFTDNHRPTDDGIPSSYRSTARCPTYIDWTFPWRTHREL